MKFLQKTIRSHTRQCTAIIVAFGVLQLFGFPQLGMPSVSAATGPVAVPDTSYANTTIEQPLAVVHGNALVSDKTPPPRADRRWVTITAYSSTPDQTDSSPFIAADGSRVYDGMIAANFLPFGTHVMIPSLFGSKVFEVHDRMNRRYQRTVDVWMKTRAEAKQFGVRYAEIVILGE